MGISTVSFNQAKIYHSRMFFTRYGKNGVYTQVFDKNGKNLLNRVSNNTVKTKKGDYTVITRKKEYEFPDKKVIFEIAERIYDKTGKLVKTEKQMVK